MLFFICTAVLVAVLIGFKLTKDIFPKPFKQWLVKKAVSNWMKSQPLKFGWDKQSCVNPKTYADIGILSGKKEILLERPLAISNPAIRDEYFIYGIDGNNGLSVKMTKHYNELIVADVLLTIDDATYQMSYQGKALSPYEFSLGNLKMEMVEPFRIWRVCYNGIMMYSTRQKNEEGKRVHVVFNFLWKALGNPMDNRKDGNPNLLANHLSSTGLFGENLPSLLMMLPEGYSQMGTLHGNVTVNSKPECVNSDDAVEEHQQFYLYGFRTRNIITTPLDTSPLLLTNKNFLNSDKNGRFEIFGMCEENGLGFKLVAHKDEWTDGRMLWPSYETTFITDIDCSPAQILHRDGFPRLFNIYDTKGTSRIEIWSFENKYNMLSNGSQIVYLKMTINGRNAKGVVIRKLFEPKNYNEAISAAHNNCACENDCLYTTGDNILRAEVSKQNYFVEFSTPACLKVPLVGGKGASLAKLAHFSSQQSEVKTARGLCATTILFRELLHLDKFSDIFKSSSGSDQSLEESCYLVMKMVKSSDAEETLSTLIGHWIEKVFGESRNEIRFAVRSSGVLEDGSDLSCAGQNETFLGVSQDLIPKKIVECWASLFTPQSVQYRLNHGQPAVSEMGVVIQEMVDASTAGVIFTADPRTGNPFQMMITANYGLGESVVSASCDPDFITLIRNGGNPNLTKDESTIGNVCKSASSSTYLSSSKWWEYVTIGKKVLGEKKSKIVCTSNKEGKEDVENSTREITVTDKESQQFCLNDETATKLGVIAGEIELFMGNHKPVDIEWAVDQNGRIFILQCRSLTALDAWTDFEILHELDVAIRTKIDRFTTANTGEVLPKAIYTITQTMARCLDFCIQQQIQIRKGDRFPLSPYTNNTCVLLKRRMFVNMFQALYSIVDKEITLASICLDQTIFGRQVIDEEIRQICEGRFGLTSAMSKLSDLAITIKLLMTFKSLVEKGAAKYKDFKLNYSNVPKKSMDMYTQISEDLIHIHQACETHLITTECNTASQLFLFLFLSEGKKASEWGSNLFEDASKLLSVFADVESGEIPGDIECLANAIIKHRGTDDGIRNDFLESSSETALDWLKSNESRSKALDNFFEKHGHRGFSEMDIGEPSWKSDPSSFLPILRNVLKNKLGGKEKEKRDKSKSPYKNDDELLDSLSTNLKPITRRLLKFILPTCRNAVACREKSKSLFVRVIGQFKEKYQELAQLMVAEHLLPNETLIVHLTHFEIGQLVNKDVSSSMILQKAMKRQKMYPLMEKLEFPEICVGVPKELDSSVPVAITDTIQATPVSRGIAKGIAKVCMSVQEASENLKPGDILITHGTDIAWSPFFPILGGVVTELGGLISHGAVVAREYGLPCIVGAVNATKIFKTGDSVVLDAGKGTLSKVGE